MIMKFQLHTKQNHLDYRTITLFINSYIKTIVKQLIFQSNVIIYRV